MIKEEIKKARRTNGKLMKEKKGSHEKERRNEYEIRREMYINQKNK